MTRTDIQQTVVEALVAVAPEIDPASLKLDLPLRDQTELDSMDFLRFVIELHRRVGVDVPESDYQKLTTVTAAVDYLVSRLARAPC